ncbi:hypothetical protein [Ferroplasma sp.]
MISQNFFVECISSAKSEITLAPPTPIIAKGTAAKTAETPKGA